MTISEYAFRASAEKLFREEKIIYFWTFTLKSVYPDWYYGETWRRFIVDISNLYGGTLKGLKVIELHKDHGLHWHALLNKRIWVGEVRRIGKRYGIGWVYVVNHPATLGAIDYLSKYLTKGFKKEQPMYAKCSRWGTVGGFQGVRVKDVVVESEFHRRMQLAQQATGKRQFPFLFTRVMFQWNDATDDQVKQAALLFVKTGCISGMMDQAVK